MGETYKKNWLAIMLLKRPDNTKFSQFLFFEEDITELDDNITISCQSYNKKAKHKGYK